jgi:hypothetical protein
MAVGLPPSAWTKPPAAYSPSSASSKKWQYTPAFRWEGSGAKITRRITHPREQSPTAQQKDENREQREQPQKPGETEEQDENEQRVKNVEHQEEPQGNKAAVPKSTGKSQDAS